MINAGMLNQETAWLKLAESSAKLPGICGFLAFKTPVKYNHRFDLNQDLPGNGVRVWNLSLEINGLSQAPPTQHFASAHPPN
jgi:hypothetical protein